jgi:hypothetical protein
VAKQETKDQVRKQCVDSFEEIYDGVENMLSVLKSIELQHVKDIVTNFDMSSTVIDRYTMKYISDAIRDCDLVKLDITRALNRIQIKEVKNGK